MFASPHCLLYALTDFHRHFQRRLAEGVAAAELPAEISDPRQRRPSSSTAKKSSQKSNSPV
jgi:hypothetical protein